MTKRLLCLLLSVIMILSLFLTSCAGNTDENEEGDGDQAEEDVLRKYTAVTIYGISEDSMTEDGLDAVEEKISNFCVARYKTSIDLRLFKASEYQSALDALYDKFAEKDEEDRIAAEAKASSEQEEKELLRSMSKEERQAYNQSKRVAEKEAKEAEKKAAEEEEKLVEEGKDKTVEAAEVQLDILYLPTMKDFYNAVDEGLVVDLKTFLSGDSKVVTDYEYPTYLAAATVNGGIYGLPTNQGVVTNETYFVVNKNLSAKYNVDWTRVRSITDLEEVFAQVRANEDGVAPIYGDFEPEDIAFYIPTEGESAGHMLSVNADQLLGGKFSTGSYSTDSKTGEINFEEGSFVKTYPSHKMNQNFLRYAALKSQWRQAGYLSDTNQNCFLRVAELSDEEVKNWNDENYELHLYRGAKFTTEAALDHGVFAISSRCADPERAMEILQLLYTNEEVHNLFAFGIEEVNYVVNNDGKTVTIVDDSYKMDLFKTGNPLLGYLSSDMDPDYIARAKEKNLNSRLDAFLGLRWDWTEPDKSEWLAVFANWSQVVGDRFDRLYYGIPNYEEVFNAVMKETTDTLIVDKTFSDFKGGNAFLGTYKTQAAILKQVDEELHYHAQENAAAEETATAETN